MEIIATYGATFLILAIIFGVFMTWGIGANDVANALGTSVGSGAITVRTAIIVAAIFEFAGAALAGGNVTRTIRKGIIDPGQIADSPESLVFGMLAALLAAGCWLAGGHPRIAITRPFEARMSLRWVGNKPITDCQTLNFETTSHQLQDDRTA